MEAIRVPSPPRLVPISRALPFSVSPDSRIAAGTLLMIWQEGQQSHVFGNEHRTDEGDENQCQNCRMMENRMIRHKPSSFFFFVAD